MYCADHPKYTGQRKPNPLCVTCWRLYLENNNKTVESYASGTSDKNLKYWLLQNIDDIIYAPLEQKLEASAEVREKIVTVLSDFGFVEEKSDDGGPEPARGTKV